MADRSIIWGRGLRASAYASITPLPPTTRTATTGARRHRLFFAVLCLLPFLAGCATTSSERMVPLQSIESLQYYPFLVKGYENTYPKRHVIVLAASDERDFKDTSGAAHSPDNG